MNKYILLTSDSFIQEIINEFDPIFPNIPITKRYSPDFLSKCIVRTEEEFNSQKIEPGMEYDKDLDIFFKVSSSEPLEE